MFGWERCFLPFEIIGIAQSLLIVRFRCALYSWDEMAHYDLPAMVNKALAVSNQTQLYYAGHSQGTMIAFAGFSTNQALAKQVKAYFALAPVADVGHIEGGLKYLSYIYKEVSVSAKFCSVEVHRKTIEQ